MTVTTHKNARKYSRVTRGRRFQSSFRSNLACSVGLSPMTATSFSLPEMTVSLPSVVDRGISVRNVENLQGRGEEDDQALNSRSLALYLCVVMLRVDPIDWESLGSTWIDMAGWTGNTDGAGCPSSALGGDKFDIRMSNRKSTTRDSQVTHQTMIERQHNLAS